eukprot:PLAT9229.1.p1 GENE.PLAT9229.1~~PLAT9229.1.p1  ORF type:complete len:252 (+),score=60.65 PLAT9229.1:114-758(+)
MRAEDVGISVPEPLEVEEDGRPSGEAPLSTVLRHVQLARTPEFSVEVFILPPGARIPLHDHPGMTVLSKALYGSVSVRAMDWMTHEARSNVAREHEPTTLAAPSVTLLGPRSGNLHAFTADERQGCALLDVLTPPYEVHGSRVCSYYDVWETPVDGEARLLQLSRVSPPADFWTISEAYKGPSLVEAGGKSEEEGEEGVIWLEEELDAGFESDE